MRGKVTEKMRKFYMIGLALCAVLGFSVAAAASASAVEFLLAEWLVNGSPITTSQNTNTEGELLLEDEKATLGLKAMVLCSGVLHGTIGPNGEDTITGVLSLTGVEISATQLSGEALSCEGQENCVEPLVWAAHLPWNTLLELMVEGTETFFVDLILNSGAGEPGWEVECMGTLGKPTDECKAPEGVTNVETVAEGLMGEFSDAFTVLAGLKLANCSLANGGALETGVVEGLGIISPAEPGKTLTASSE
jgi:hypothetical protein